ncbi:unnamed protein product [Brachionus calyciflorus]|uniref:Uncharacterized protein n=1 Tax=Brachionus calyciflorus TaxID=104777 RepID=A0A813MDI5_9BILA|nr:unnamed protein product [Brachionus calyciflorus]
MESPYKKVKSSSSESKCDSKENLTLPKRAVSDICLPQNEIRQPLKPLQILADISSNTQPLSMPETQPTTSKPSQTKSHEFCCVYRNNDKKFCVLKTCCIKAPSIDSISIGKTYDITIGKLTVKGIVKFLGNKPECFNQLKHLETYCSSQSSQKVTKRKTISIDSIKSINENEDSTQQLKNRIRELEKQLSEKEQIIDQQNEEIKIKRDIIEFYKNNFDNEKVQKIKSFCASFIEVFNSPDGKERFKQVQEYRDNWEQILQNHKDITVTAEMKKDFMAICEVELTFSGAFRKILFKILPDTFLWARNNRKIMEHKYGNIIDACVDFVKQKFPNFNKSQITRTISDMCYRSRQAYAKQGYTIVTKFDSITQTSCYDIFKNDDEKNSFEEGDNEELVDEYYDDLVEALDEYNQTDYQYQDVEEN